MSKQITITWMLAFIFNRLGKPKDLYLVKVAQVTDNSYRVNVWREAFPEVKSGGFWKTHEDILKTRSITDSFFVRADENGEIVSSNPKIEKKY